MALLNDAYYIFVEKESVTNDVTTVTHPTESGMPIADTVRRKPIIINISGKIVEYSKTYSNPNFFGGKPQRISALGTISAIKLLQKQGTHIKYSGQAGTFTNLQIQSFNTDFDNKNFGGANFEMTLQEVRIASSAYVAPKVVKSTKKYPSKGDIVEFSGGKVYEASDSVKHSSTRGKSTCRLTKISKLVPRKRDYHLISIDGKGVYGWVDNGTVTFTSSTSQTFSSGGTQQVNLGDKTATYHTVKKGDTVYAISRKYYKSLGTDPVTLELFIINNNLSAFSRKNASGVDVKSLQIGARLLIAGKRS